MPHFAYVILAVGWLLWATPFALARRNRQVPQQLDRRARWGMLLMGIAYALLWQVHFWERALPAWRLAVSVFFLALAIVLSWSSTRSLGRQWRLDAGLNADHELVRSGPYRVVRHPIYASMLCLLLGIGFMIASPLQFAAAVVILVAGAEVRVRIEDRLLESRFGEQFREYQRRVPAYVPFLR